VLACDGSGYLSCSWLGMVDMLRWEVGVAGWAPRVGARRLQGILVNIRHVVLSLTWITSAHHARLDALLISARLALRAIARCNDARAVILATEREAITGVAQKERLQTNNANVKLITFRPKFRIIQPSWYQSQQRRQSFMKTLTICCPCKHTTTELTVWQQCYTALTTLLLLLFYGHYTGNMH